MQILSSLRRLEHATPPSDPDCEAALARRFAELPAHVRTDAQLLGRRTAGCEGTHGVFPKCTFACRPCYHGEQANRVRVDGPHTLREVDAQMRYLRDRRGPGQFAQLIGGEVSLLDPDDHAEALAIMRRHGRVPMSFTHGDFDYAYLERLALDRDGAPRTRFLSFSVHIDTTMVGRRGARRPASEAELHGHRRRFCAMFDRLEREHGVRSYLAHTMTVTPANVGQIADVIATCHGLGFRMFSFQPAAYVGDDRRWSDGFRAIDDATVWAEIERGAGTRLPFRAVQLGDERCNRATWGVYVGDRYVPLLDDREPRDLAASARLRATSRSPRDRSSPPVSHGRRSRGRATRQPGSPTRRASLGASGQRRCAATCGPSRSRCTASWTPPTSAPPGS